MDQSQGSFLNYISMMKYPCQAVLLLFFQDNPAATFMGSEVEGFVNLLELNQPSTLWGNIAVSLAFYAFFIITGFFCLKYMYKERR